MRSWTTGLLLVAYVLTATYGLYQMKSAGQMGTRLYLAGLVAYAVSFVLWLVLLLRMPLSVAFPLVTGLVIVTTQIVGIVWLHEPVAWPRLCAVALILSGVSLLLVKA